MVEESPEVIDPSPDSARARRTPPTIDLKAVEVTDETPDAGAKEEAKETAEQGAEPEPAPPRSSRAITSALIAAVSGASTAALVIAATWFTGWPATTPVPPAAPQVNAAAVDDLTARVAGLESKIARPAAPASDPAVAGRVDALEKSQGTLRGDLAGLRAQSEKLAAAINDVKTTPRDTSVSPDLAALSERVGQLERARAQSTEVAQAKPADDAPLRRVVAGALLDVLVRVGDPFPAALAAAKSLAADPNALKPLDGFADKGVPHPAALSRELLTLVPKLSPPPENATTGAGLVDRLQAGAAKLVRIERTDTVGNDRGAIVARVTAAALRNDYAEARRELNTLSPADRGAAQAWIDKADARDAAIAASRKFAAEAMAALAKPAQ
jgi:hypothetical protein